MKHAAGLNRSEQVANVLHGILRVGAETRDLGTLISRIRDLLGPLIDTTNFYVGLYDPATETYRFPFFADQHEDADPDVSEALPKSLTDYVRRTGKPALVDENLLAELVGSGQAETVGPASHQWMGAPLVIRRSVIGVVSVQSYDDPALYSADDLELLDATAGTIAIAVERMRAEEALRESRENLSLVFDTVGDVLFQLRVEGENGYRFALVNTAFLEITGLREDQVVGMRVEDVIPEPTHELVFEKYAQAIRDRSTVRWEETSTYPAGRLTGIVAVTPVFDDSGVCTHLVGSVHDITARKLAEERATRLGWILENSIDEIYVFDTDTLRFTQVNRGARRNLGYSITELGRMTPLDLKPEFTAETFAAMTDPLRTGDEAEARFETVHRRKDGSLYPVEVHLQLVIGEPDPVFVAIILDITDRKRIEEELAQHRRHLEEEILKRTADLRKAVDLMAGREGRMAELKKEVRKLKDLLARHEEGRRKDMNREA